MGQWEKGTEHKWRNLQLANIHLPSAPYVLTASYSCLCFSSQSSWPPVSIISKETKLPTELCSCKMFLKCSIKQSSRKVSKPVHVLKSLGKKETLQVGFKSQSVNRTSVLAFIIVLLAADKNELIRGRGLVCRQLPAPSLLGPAQLSDSHASPRVERGHQSALFFSPCPSPVRWCLYCPPVFLRCLQPREMTLLVQGLQLVSGSMTLLKLDSQPSLLTVHYCPHTGGRNTQGSSPGKCRNGETYPALKHTYSKGPGLLTPPSSH